jgi:pyruvate formate lyase activating enzyme
MIKSLNTFTPARLYQTLPDGSVECGLCPRRCRPADGKPGFCRVRTRKGNALYTLNYGKAIRPAQEVVETEAVFHFMPGSPMLAMGNLGCNLNCDFCQNWETSQIENLRDSQVQDVSVRDVVDMAVSRGLPIVSWTYNDPVVWFEFVMDAGRALKEAGIVNLFKSAHYITLEAMEQLSEVIDIFSVSVKSLNAEFYKTFTRGTLPPVLEAAKFAFQAGKHVEISNLMVTEANTGEEDARRVADWHLANLSDETPLHYVAFHPAYRYTHVGRTPLKVLERAREIAMGMGVKYCYIGNVFDCDAVHTYCPTCGARLIERYGLNAQNVGLTAESACKACGRSIPIRRLREAAMDKTPTACAEPCEERTFLWHDDIKSVHVELTNPTGTEGAARYVRVGGQNGAGHEVKIAARQRWRFSICKNNAKDRGVTIRYPARFTLHMYELLDRAHYPTTEAPVAETEG